MDAGYFRGASSEQDGRFSDKEKKLLKTMKFEAQLEQKIDLNRINMDVIKPWITLKVNEILGMEDDVVIEYILSQLETKDINPKLLQINVTGFLNARQARLFVGELWNLFIEANESEDGIPASLVNKKLAEMKVNESGRGADREEDDWTNRYKTLSNGRYTGPNREKEVRDDRIPARALSPRKTPPRRNASPSRRRSPAERRRRSSERPSGAGNSEKDKDREEETKRREIERKKRHEEAEKRRRRSRSPVVAARKRSRTRSPVVAARKRSKSRSPMRKRSRSPVRRSPIRKRSRTRSPIRRKSRSRSPVRRRSSRSRSPLRKRSRSPARRRQRSPENSETDSEEEERRRRRHKKEKKSKKSKKEKKSKKHRRRRSPSDSESGSQSD